MDRLTLLLLLVASCSSTAQNDTGGAGGTQSGGAAGIGGNGTGGSGGSGATGGASGASGTNTGGASGTAGAAGRSGSGGTTNDAGPDGSDPTCSTPCASNTSCVAGACKQVISLFCNVAACPPAYPHQMGQYPDLYECSSDECSADIHGGVICTLDSDYAKGSVPAAASCPPGTHQGTSVLDCTTGNTPAFCIPD